MEEWFNNETKREELLRRFPEEIAVFQVKMCEFTLCCVDLEANFNRIFDEWSSLEMFDDKIRLLQSGRTLSEIYNFSELMTLQPQQFSERLQKMFLDWKMSAPKSMDSIIYWNDLIAYRREFCHRSSEKMMSENIQISDAENSLIDIELNLLDVAFLQKKSDAAQQLIRKLKTYTSNSNENILRCNLSIGKYDLIIAEHKLNINFTEAIKKMRNSWGKLKKGVLDHESLEDFKEININTLFQTSDIALKLATVYQKIDTDEFNDDFMYLCRGSTELMDVDGENEINMINEFLQYSEKSLKIARNIAQEYLNAEYSPEREIILGNVHFRLGQFYRKVFTSTNQVRIKKLINFS